MSKNDHLSTELVKITSEISGYKKLEVPAKIKTNKEHLLASDAVKYLNDKLKLVETTRKNLVAPLVEEKKTIDGAFKALVSPLEGLLNDVKAKMLDYTKRKAQEQLEYEAKKRAENPDSTELVIDDKEAKIKHGEVSTNYVKKTTCYRVADPLLQNAVVIKVMALEEYLKTHKLPKWLESYETEQIVVRTS